VPAFGDGWVRPNLFTEVFLPIPRYCALGLAACALLYPATVYSEDQRPVPSIQDIMDTLVDPSADAIWDSVGLIETKDGTHARTPGDKEWRALKLRAEKLIEGAEHLQTPRPVGGDGHGALADATTPGIRNAAQIRGDIDANPARFKAAAERLRLAGQDAATAIAAKDAKALLVAGAHMDDACEACHSAYWYPRTPPLPLPDDAAYSRFPALTAPKAPRAPTPD
jgi:hypothetical protein